MASMGPRDSLTRLRTVPRHMRRNLDVDTPIDRYSAAAADLSHSEAGNILLAPSPTANETMHI